MEVNSSAKMRQRAIDWLNSKDRDIEKGIKVLEDACYKPSVMEIFRKKITRMDIPGKVLQEVRNYLRYFASPQSEVHKDLVVDQDMIEKVKTIGEDSTDEYPADMKQVIQELSDVYKQRGMFHNQLNAVGEGNTTEQKAERRKLLAIIKACSDRIEILSVAYEKFKAEGTLPTANTLKAVFDADKVKVEADKDEKPEKEEKKFELAAKYDDLKKQADNWRIKLAKAENKLLYQVEKKMDKPNPIPEGPKRIKQQKRIAQLKAEKEQIDLAIVNWN